MRGVVLGGTRRFGRAVSGVFVALVFLSMLAACKDEPKSTRWNDAAADGEPKDDLQASIDNGIKKIDDNNYEIDKALVDKCYSLKNCGRQVEGRGAWKRPVPLHRGECRIPAREQAIAAPQ